MPNVLPTFWVVWLLLIRLSLLFFTFTNKQLRRCLLTSIWRGGEGVGEKEKPRGLFCCFSLVVVKYFFAYKWKRSKQEEEKRLYFFPPSFHPPAGAAAECGLNKGYWLGIGSLIGWLMEGPARLMTVGRGRRSDAPEGNYCHSVSTRRRRRRAQWSQIKSDWRECAEDDGPVRMSGLSCIAKRERRRWRSA